MPPLITVIGEALVDLVPDEVSGPYREKPGGSPFNVAVGLARLGNRTALMARFSDDPYGRLLRAAAAAEGIDLRAAPHAPEPATVATAAVDHAGHVTYQFDMDGTADWQWTAAQLHELDPGTELLHFGSIASWTPPGAARIGELVRDLRGRGATLISYDPNIRPSVFGGRERGWWSDPCARLTSSRRVARTSNGCIRSSRWTRSRVAGLGSERRWSS